MGSFADPNFPPQTFSVWQEVMHPWLGVAKATEHFLPSRPPDQLTRLLTISNPTSRPPCWSSATVE
jgi:hypothetical protein